MLFDKSEFLSRSHIIQLELIGAYFNIFNLRPRMVMNGNKIII